MFYNNRTSKPVVYGIIFTEIAINTIGNYGKNPVMKKSILIHIDTKTRAAIANEEIVFLSLLKINRLSSLGNDVLITEIMLLDSDEDCVTAVVRIQTDEEEYSGYSRNEHWESALTTAFDSILQQVRLISDINFRVQENTN